MTSRVTTVIMAYVKSDQVKHSVNNLEKYRLIKEDKVKLFIHKAFDQCGSLLRKIMLEGEMYHLLTQLPLTVEERNNLVVYSRTFCQCGTKLEWFAQNAYWFLVPIRLVSLLALTFFMDWTGSSETIKAWKHLHSSVYFGIVTRRMYERQKKENEQWPSQPLSRVYKIKTY